MLVNLAGSWESLSKEAMPKLATLSQQIAIVVVASDRDAKDVTDQFGKPPFPIVLDPPVQPDGVVGAVTRSWGVTALPESLLVDAKGIVRYHFQNTRNWDSPPASRCIRAFVASP